ncbi:uncharacterized protein LOC105432173 [Pogonomyrmex barbatus]|uniref:Uncharacterized protein LOC105432173 n=1 Tax=Pogonomyrmex barbatus TaxID=144034 RepID=A0A6I9XHW0_9HYME|nr:uncharacterized protein LOC105432173 [Pogonomyrmex barbatus]
MEDSQNIQRIFLVDIGPDIRCQTRFVHIAASVTCIINESLRLKIVRYFGNNVCVYFIFGYCTASLADATVYHSVQALRLKTTSNCERYGARVNRPPVDYCAVVIIVTPNSQRHSQDPQVDNRLTMPYLSALFPLIFLLAGVNAAGIGEAWQVMPHVKSVYTDHPFRPRLDSSAFEVRTVSGVGRLAPFDESRDAQKHPEHTTPSFVEPNTVPEGPKEVFHENKSLERFRKLLEDSSYSNGEIEDDVKSDGIPIQKIFQKTLMMRILHADKENDDDDDDDDDDDNEQTTRGTVQRIRRQAENETSMEKISTMKSVREARLSSPETWSTAAQPISVEFRHRIPLDQVIQQQQEEEEAAALSSIYRRHQAPRVDFVTGQNRRYPDYRESRDIPLAKNYDDYEQTSWYRNAIRERDYEYPSYRRGYSYQYPDRYRMERDYYMRSPSDQYYYDRYDRYRDDDLDLYGRNRPSAPKPRRIIYYATLPEIVRKPVDLRNYPRYDANAIRTPVTRDDAYKRIPGNVDPGKYRYRQSYGGYDPYTKRSSYYDRPYGYPEGDSRRVRVSTKEDLRNDGFGGVSNERKVSNLIAIRDDESGKLPWPVQIGAEVSIKDDERIPGRKIFGESSVGYERFQSAQLQKAPDATGSSEFQSDN